MTSAELVANGAAVDLHLVLLCQGLLHPEFGGLTSLTDLGLHVEQKRGRRAVVSDAALWLGSGGFFGAECPLGIVTRVSVVWRVFAVDVFDEAGGLGIPFHSGPLSVTATLHFCDDGFINCASAAAGTPVRTTIQGMSNLVVTTRSSYGTSAKVAEHGHAVDVSFQILCTSPESKFDHYFLVVRLTVAQAVGNRLTEATRSDPDPDNIFFTGVGVILCTAVGPQTLTIRALAPSRSRFHSGKALVTAFVEYQSPDSGFEFGPVSYPIRIEGRAARDDDDRDADDGRDDDDHRVTTFADVRRPSHPRQVCEVFASTLKSNTDPVSHALTCPSAVMARTRN